MFPQDIYAFEILITFGAFNSFCVGPFVAIQILVGHECHVTFGACVWLLPMFDSPVPFHMAVI